MKSKRKWTIEEDNILVQAVKANPHNLQSTFKRVSELIDRTETAVEMRWYYKLKKTSNCFITVSKNKTLKNGKIVAINTQDKSEKTNKTLWEKIKILLKW